MKTDQNRGASPRQELSRAFREYALPLLEFAGPAVTKPELQQFLQLAALAWNAVLEDKLDRRKDTVAEMTRMAPGRPRRLKNLLAMMVARKQIDFAEEQRFIQHFTVTRQRGQWRLHAEPAPAPAGKI